jgi:hypothetical protein
MISNDIREFVEYVLDKRQISDADVQKLSYELLGDRVISHEIIDVLVALDRTITAPNANWAEFLVATTVDHVVWASRPTGVVTRELAQWLIATLTVGEGPTANAMRIAFEIVREADRCDETLISFAMGKAGLKARQDLSRSDAALLVA